MILKFFIISIILFTAFNFIFLNFTLAKEPVQSNVSCSTNPNAYPWCNIKKIGGESGLINKFYNYALALVGVTALGAIIFGGVKYTISAGNSSAQADAISWITGAVWGLILLLGANLLLRTINPQLVELKLDTLKVKPLDKQASKVSNGNVCCLFNSPYVGQQTSFTSDISFKKISDSYSSGYNYYSSCSNLPAKSCATTSGGDGTSCSSGSYNLYGGSGQVTLYNCVNK